MRLVFPAAALTALLALPCLAPPAAASGPDGYAPHGDHRGWRQDMRIRDLRVDTMPDEARPARAPGVSPPGARPVMVTVSDPVAYGPPPAATMVVELVDTRSPYIGRGLIYNVPPDPFAFASGGVVRAKY